MNDLKKISCIYVVATPIGNLDDITTRAIKILKNVDLIACEDTRVSRKLLAHFGVTGKQLITYADFDETKKADQLVTRIQEERLSLALISDAGTPCISDPGYRLVTLARKNHIKIFPVPGPSAPIALASVSGLPTDRILFIGFLPHKESAILKEITTWAQTHASIIFLESTRRLKRSLAHIESMYPQAMVCIGRELTKLYEETITISISEASQWIVGHETLKGEVTVMVSLPTQAGASNVDSDDIIRDAQNAFAKGETLKDLLQKFKKTGLSRSELYQLLLKAKNEE